MRRPAAFLSLILIVLLMLASGGCASLSLAAIGTALGVAGSAASSGSSVYHLGKLDDVFMANAQQVRLAVILASADLQLQLVQDRRDDPKKQIWVTQLIDDQGANLTVTVEARSTRLSRCRVDVGFFGSEPTSRLFMDRLRAHLPLDARAAAKPLASGANS